jgi:DNA-binding transcriptional regulator YbjK
MDYHLFHELLETYRSLNDWLKALWLVTPPVFVLGLTGLLLHHRRARATSAQLPGGQTLYSVSQMDDGEMRVFSHLPELGEIDRAKLLARVRKTEQQEA